MRRTIAALTLILTACGQSEVERAEKELNMIELAKGSGNELCTAKRKVADAYLRDQRPQNDYELRRLEANLDCQRVQLDPDFAILGESYNSLTTADNLEAMADNAIAEEPKNQPYEDGL